MARNPHNKEVEMAPHSKTLALLIGIDCYLPNKLNGGWSYGNLGGCVRDINSVETYLREDLSISGDRVIKLTSTAGAGSEPSEPRSKWPTFANIVAAFKRITGWANPGDVVYLHYSGHGGRAQTIYPELKGEAGIDEALVPMDIDGGAGQFLRDVQIAFLLKRMVEKNLIVTIVLDCCHAGSGTRGHRARAVVRGLPHVDRTRRNLESTVAGRDELIAVWKGLQEVSTRTLKSGSGWLLEPKGYTLIAACRANESAFEFAVHGGEKRGALTYWMLDSLRQIDSTTTYKTLLETVRAKIHSQFQDQTPQVEGEANRVVFGATEVAPQYNIIVMDVDQKKRRIQLGAGRAGGLRKHARLAVYPAGQTIDMNSAPQVLVEISSLNDVSSWATIVEEAGDSEIKKGALAVLLYPGVSSLCRTVCLVRRDDLEKTIVQEAPLKSAATAIEKMGSGFIQLIRDDDVKTAPDFQVAVNQAGEFEIWNPAGDVLQNVRPPLKYDDANASAVLAQRLVHLAKYKNVHELTNNSNRNRLSNKLIVSLIGKQAEYDPEDEPNPEPLEDSQGPVTIKNSEWLFLRIENRYTEPLNITVLDLQPDWGITQVYPAHGAAFELLDPDGQLILPLRAQLPNDYPTAIDMVKVFATIKTTDFRWLALPALDNPSRGWVERGLSAPRGELENLFFRLMEADGPKARTVSIPPAANSEWTTMQVEIRIE
jgi:hypothetical protein